jgi:hypothetical protein
LFLPFLLRVRVYLVCLQCGSEGTKKAESSGKKKKVGSLPGEDDSEPAKAGMQQQQHESVAFLFSLSLSICCCRRPDGMWLLTFLCIIIPAGALCSRCSFKRCVHVGFFFFLLPLSATLTVLSLDASVNDYRQSIAPVLFCCCFSW